jgi:hypothetical protein
MKLPLVSNRLSEGPVGYVSVRTHFTNANRSEAKGNTGGRCSGNQLLKGAQENSFQ